MSSHPACWTSIDGDGVSLRLERSYPADDSPWGVPALRFDILQSGARCGTVSLRIGPDEGALRFAGHIGFAVDAPYRGARLAERAARLVLPVAAAHGLDCVWLTCEPTNAASIRTIERLGAEFVELIDLPPTYEAYARGERQKRRYKLRLQDRS
jgi:tagatose 1,6-diphosphate aldolase